MVRARKSVACVALAFIVVVISNVRPVESTCVFEGDFGFKFNCAFKQSGIFRVRNLGGVKGYFGLGLSLGDELGFTQSLSNLEGNRRRSAGGALEAAAAAAEKRADGQTDTPAFKAIHPKMPMLRAASSAPTASGVPAFQSLPSTSISRSSTVGKQSDGRDMTAFRNAIRRTVNSNVRPPPVQKVEPERVRIVSVATAANRRTVGESVSDEQRLAMVDAELDANIEALSKAANVSADSIRAALGDKNNRQQLQQAVAAMSLLRAPSTTTTTTAAFVASTTPRAVTANINYIPDEPLQAAPQKYYGVNKKVMNAPKEYYPVNYDKNFDDGFKTRVELPPTSFSCGEQKHFPGLYADEDLGCMVFHVCALTDDGLVQKSFLCPENTIFDQSVLKCNWWFYVDCATSKKLYDSNIPVSKSYQLMKALAFFSSYKNNNSNEGKIEAAK